MVILEKNIIKLKIVSRKLTGPCLDQQRYAPVLKVLLKTGGGAVKDKDQWKGAAMKVSINEHT